VERSVVALHWCLLRSRFDILASRFVFKFGSRFDGSAFAVRTVVPGTTPGNHRVEPEQEPKGVHEVRGVSQFLAQAHFTNRTRRRGL